MFFDKLSHKLQFYWFRVSRNLISGDNVDLLHDFPLLCHELCLLQPYHVRKALVMVIMVIFMVITVM